MTDSAPESAPPTDPDEAPALAAVESFGPCMDCGREQTRNPHPHAGEPGHEEAGYTWHCVPCLVENRHRWAVRAMRAESVVSRVEALVRDPNVQGVYHVPIARAVREALGLETANAT